MNEQKQFWDSNFSEKYRKSNAEFDDNLQMLAWQKMLKSVKDESLGSILECGCNMGRNLTTLRKLYPQAGLSLIELNEMSYKMAVQAINPVTSFNGLITESDFSKESFDLTFTCGVLIHVAPYDLYLNMNKLYDYSRKYILVAEYFARKLEMVLYHGEVNKLFKMDFGRYFLDNFKVRVLDYGFLWGGEFDAGGFDDITWWLFEKR